MIRVVFQHGPQLYGLQAVPVDDPALLAPVVQVDGHTYYRAQTKDHYVLYRPALSGWGEAAPNPADTRPVFDPRQR